MRIFYRIWRPRIGVIDSPLIRYKSNPWVQLAYRKPNLLGCDDFIFFGQSGALKDIGWDGSCREKLWRYNQHYFDDLNAFGSKLRITWHRCLIEDWILKNPGSSGTGWEPYPTSLRIVNWIKWAFSGNSLDNLESTSSFNKSLITQASWLSRRLEFHILGNHLFANAKALVFAGLYFRGAEANAFFENRFENYFRSAG